MNALLRGLGWITWLVIAGAVTLASGVATNQVLNDGKWDRGWLAVALVAAVGVAVVGVLGARFGGPEGGARGLASRGLHRAYLRQTRLSVRYMETVGVATRGAYALGMRQVYVDVSLAAQPYHDAAREPYLGRAPATGERRSLESFLRSGSRVLVVIGGPGSGKTTLTRRTTLDLAARWWRFWQRRPLPVLMYLRDHGAAITGEAPPTLAEAATAVPWLDDKVPAAWLGGQLDRGRCLVLLDGLDEVADATDRARVVTWVRKQIDRYPGNRYVLTSRPHGYESDPIATADVLQVRRFSGAQISRFLHAWYLETERRATGSSGKEVTAAAARKADDLLGRLYGQASLYDLAANPLLLTMIANVHLYRGALPGSRADLYKEMCDVLLHRRQQAKGLSDATELRGPQKERIAQSLAWTMTVQGDRNIEVGDAHWVVEPVLRQVSGRLSPDVFLDECRKSGLLVERENGVYSFAHLTLQEYLAAAYVSTPAHVEVLAGKVDDPSWRETILLWAAGADATPVVRACAASGSARALALAFDCLEEALSVDAEVRAEVEALLNEAEPGSERARLIRAVVATRLLGETMVLSDGTAVCARPVSRALYALFALDEQALGLHTPVPRARESDEPMTGMWEDDVARFVEWLNAHFTDAASFRLPIVEEVTDSAIAPGGELARRTVWVAGRDDQPPWLRHAPDASEVLSDGTWRHYSEQDLPAAMTLLPATFLPRPAIEEYGELLGEALEEVSTEQPANVRSVVRQLGALVTLHARMALYEASSGHTPPWEGLPALGLRINESLTQVSEAAAAVYRRLGPNIPEIWRRDTNLLSPWPRWQPDLADLFKETMSLVQLHQGEFESELAAAFLLARSLTTDLESALRRSPPPYAPLPAVPGLTDLVHDVDLLREVTLNLGADIDPKIAAAFRRDIGVLPASPFSSDPRIRMLARRALRGLLTRWPASQRNYRIGEAVVDFERFLEQLRSQWRFQRPDDADPRASLHTFLTEVSPRDVVIERGDSRARALVEEVIDLMTPILQRKKPFDRHACVAARLALLAALALQSGPDRHRLGQYLLNAHDTFIIMEGQQAGEVTREDVVMLVRG